MRISFLSSITKKEKQKIIALLLALIAGCIYAVFTSASLDDFDSYNFVWALQNYDPYHGIPHPPGYFLYVMTGKLAYTLLGDATYALFFLSAASSTIAIYILYYANSYMFNDAIAFISTALIMTMPIVWLTSEKVLSDTYGMLTQSIILLSIYKSTNKHWPSWIPPLLIGIFLGARPQSLIGITAAFMIISINRKPSAKDIAKTIFSMSTGLMAWFIPFSYFFDWDARKIANYLYKPIVFITSRESVYASSSLVIEAKNRISYILDHSTMLLFHVNSEKVRVSALIISISIAVYIAIKHKNRTITVPLLAWLIVDTFIYIFLLNTENTRYMITFIIPWITLFAFGLTYITGKNIAIFMTLTLTLMNIIASSSLAFSLHTDKAPPYKLASYIRSNFTPKETLIVARLSYNALKYHLKQYNVLFADYFGDEGILSEISKKRPRYIIISDPEAFIPGDNYVEIQRVVYRRNPLIHEKHSVVVANIYELSDHLPNHLLALPQDGIIDVGTAQDGRYILEGWYRRENIGGITARWMGKSDKARIRVMLPIGSYTLKIRAMSFHKKQAVSFYCNDKKVSYTEIPPSWTNIGITLTSDCVREGDITYITIQAPNRISPSELGVSTDKRRLSIAVAELKFSPDERK